MTQVFCKFLLYTEKLTSFKQYLIGFVNLNNSNNTGNPARVKILTPEISFFLIYSVNIVFLQLFDFFTITLRTCGFCDCRFFYNAFRVTLQRKRETLWAQNKDKADKALNYHWPSRGQNHICVLSECLHRVPLKSIGTSI